MSDVDRIDRWTCVAYTMTRDGERPYEACHINHKSLGAAQKCWVVREGRSRLRRYEIRRGGVVVERGAGPRQVEMAEEMGAGIRWHRVCDMLTGETNGTVSLHGHTLIATTHRHVTPAYLRGMCRMLAALARCPQAADILAMVDVADPLPDNVVTGPWAHP